VPLSTFIPEPLLSLLSAANHRRKSDRIGRARGKHGKSCLLVMNGPSLNQSIEWLQARATDGVIAVNHFADTEHFEVLRPEVYVVQDTYFWQPEAMQTYREKREATFEALNRKTSWQMQLWLPSQCSRRAWIAEQIDNPNIDICYWNSGFIRRRRREGGYLGTSSVVFQLWRREWASPPPDNVLVAALYIAERLGFSDLSIIGADFSFFQEMRVDQKTNRVGRKVEHFYGEEFRPIYRGKTGEHPTTMSHEMLRWHRAFRSLEVIAEYLKMQNVRAVNSSGQSFIDCFPRA